MIEVEGLCVEAGSFALRDLCFAVPRGAYAVLMGRTGTGKTTLLESICGLRRVRSGRIRVADREVGGLPASARGIGYVPQDGALFPTLSVREHLAFAAEVRGRSRADAAAAVERWSGRLGLEALLDRRPRGLSGGERQKVALGRALAAEPAVLLLDEPLAALDEQSWEQSLELLRAVHAETGVSVLHVTHRRMEAQALADRVLWLREGVVDAEDPPGR